MMENRSFDHFLGWLPGADGMQAGLAFTDKQGATHPTFALAPNFQNCQFDDPDHSYDGGRTQFNGGANDGWLRAVDQRRLPDRLLHAGRPLLLSAARCRRGRPSTATSAAIMGPTYPNRFYMHAAQTDRIEQHLRQSHDARRSGIGSRRRALSGTYYYSDLPVLALWGSRYAPISKPFDDFLADAGCGHPAERLVRRSALHRRGPGHVERRSSARRHPQRPGLRQPDLRRRDREPELGRTPCWSSTTTSGAASSTTSPPPLAPLTDLDPMLGNDGRLGFRVPCLLVSPLARRGFVGHKQYDHTSILSMIEWRWGLDPLTRARRDRQQHRPRARLQQPRRT